MKNNKLALVSVSDKTDLIPFVKGLRKLGIEIVSTGGTLKYLKENGVQAKSITELTGFPEILEGRVKTLHPKVHGGLLYRRGIASHRKEAKKHDIRPIDFVVVNLYPFHRVIRKPKVKFEEAIENIDIGGPSMLRSAAKNFESVAVITDPKDYKHVLEELRNRKGKLSIHTRRELARKVFDMTSRYDAIITSYLKETASGNSIRKRGHHVPSEMLPDNIVLSLTKLADLRYGENPHQRAALYEKNSGERGPAIPIQMHGKELSFNNLMDAESARAVIVEFAKPAACVIKHNNPCGIAEARTIKQAVSDAIDSDPQSAFGGVIGINRKCDLETARLIFNRLKFFDVLIAPNYDEKALEFLRKRPNLRLLKVDLASRAGAMSYRVGDWGILVQDADAPLVQHEKDLIKNIKCVTKIKAQKDDCASMLFAWKCAKLVRSNAIVLVQGTKTVGIGAGQMSRVDSVQIACVKAGQRAWGSILASDGFFPMPDNIDLAHQHGIRLIIQPGGSIKDQEVIEACNRSGIGMCFTGQRHFKH